MSEDWVNALKIGIPIFCLLCIVIERALSVQEVEPICPHCGRVDCSCKSDGQKSTKEAA